MSQYDSGLVIICSASNKIYTLTDSIEMQRPKMKNSFGKKQYQNNDFENALQLAVQSEGELEKSTKIVNLM